MKKDSKFRGHKSPDLFIISICRGLACYLKYLDIKGSNSVFYEALLRLPIAEIASSRGWAYQCEYKLEKSGVDEKSTKEGLKQRKGSYKKIDFVFSYYEQIIALEMKFLKPKRQKIKEGKKSKVNKQTLNLTNDVQKIIGPFRTDSNVLKFNNKYAYIIVVKDKLAHDSFIYKGFSINKTIRDDGTLDNKRNILNSNESFLTSIVVGNSKKIYVEAIKIELK